MVEVDPLLLFAGVGMISVGLVSMIYWSERAKFRYFVFGGLLWLSAIGVKLAMDYTVTPKLNSWLISTFGKTIVTSMWAGLYVGLRTGLFECGFPYLVFLKTKLREANWSEAIALGIGFGALEAIVTGVQSLLSILTMMTTPEILSSLPPEMREAVLRQLGYGGWVVPVPILERAFVLLAHIFATSLVIYAVKEGNWSYFAVSFGYKSLLDGVIPLLNFFTPTKTLTELYLIEIPVIVFGTIGIFGVRLMKQRLGVI